MLNKNSKLAVLCGGISSEREVSLRSGHNCFNALKRKGYKNIELVDVKTLEDLLVLKSNGTEAVLLTTHGKFGEDGALQGILEWLKIPYTGSSILGCAVSMDKWLTKQIAINIGLNTGSAHQLTKDNYKNLDYEKIWSELSKSFGAIFLKPKDDGSSVNIFKIKSLEELIKKVNEIDLNSSDFLIEEFISGRELTVGVIYKNNNYLVLPILELRPKNEFYDYEAKYTKGMTEFILPAQLPETVKEKIEKDSVNIFRALGCSSYGRVDFILSNEGKPYLLEVNSLPGMTDTSDLPAQAKAYGIDYDDLVEIILLSARLHK